MMPDNIDQNLRGGADSLPLVLCFIDQRFSFCVQLLHLFDDRLCPNEKIDQRLARRQRFLNLPKLCIAETGNVTNEVNEPVLQHSLPCCWLYRRPINRSKRTDSLRPWVSVYTKWPAKAAVVQVFGRRHDEPFHALWRGAAKKRQSTETPAGWHWGGSRGHGGGGGGAGGRGGGNPTERVAAG